MLMKEQLAFIFLFGKPLGMPSNVCHIKREFKNTGLILLCFV